MVKKKIIIIIGLKIIIIVIIIILTRKCSKLAQLEYKKRHDKIV